MEQLHAGLCLEVLRVEQQHSGTDWGYNGSRLTASLITISRQELNQERRTGIPPPVSDSSRLFPSCSRWARAELQVTHPDTNQPPPTNIGLKIETSLLIFVPVPALSVLISRLSGASWMRASVCVDFVCRPSVYVRRLRIKRVVTLKGNTCARWKWNIP